ncbi:MAG: hypothetical protein D6766_11710 [Verrucomicrobia bacterium]|nr:MAG: hypothetical protein D6766_11710 [Verrucomicrobiota bacterium]
MNGPGVQPFHARRGFRLPEALAGALAVIGLGLAVVVGTTRLRAAESTNAPPKAPASETEPAAAEDAGDEAPAPPPAEASKPEASKPEAGTAAETAPAAEPGAARPSSKPERSITPYLTIVERNPFGLVDPPPPKPPEPEPKQEEVKPSALKLTGISTLLGPKHAMFVLQEPGKKPVYSGLVAEGESDPYIAGLEVLRIDPQAGSVRVRYGGNELLLDFKNNGIEPPKAKAVARTTRPGSRTTGAVPRVQPPSASRTSTGRSTGSAVIRAGNTSFRAPGVSSRSATSAGSGVRTTIPPRTTRTTVTPRPKAPPLSPAEQAILMRAQRLEAQRRGIPMPPALPIPEIDSPAPDAPAAPPLPPMPGQ